VDTRRGTEAQVEELLLFQKTDCPPCILCVPLCPTVLKLVVRFSEGLKIEAFSVMEEIFS